MGATGSMPPLSPQAVLHLRRVRAMLWFGAGLMILMGSSWALFFAYQKAWVIVSVDILMLASGIRVAFLTLHHRTREAFYLLLISMYFVVTGISLVFDLPSEAAPRSTHHFLLVLALSALLVLREERGRLRHWLAGLCFATFAVLAAYSGGISTEYGLPDSIRVGGTWVNTVFSVSAVYAIVHIMVSDLAKFSTHEQDLRRGVLRHEFFLVYQPQVNASGMVTGAEALLRWQHPRRGLVPPGEFIGLAEETGLIVPLGLQALEAACHQLVYWADDPHLSALTLSVNVSAQQFSQKDFVAQVQGVLEGKGVVPKRLKLELTESLLVQDVEDVVQKMSQLRALGVGFSLDDFGTGYSSLSYLKRLPLDQLKIDQSFVREVLTNSHDAAIARTVIHLGKDLGFAVIAEGVETEGQREFLIDNGCYIFQGYLFSKPLPLTQFLEYVRRA